MAHNNGSSDNYILPVDHRAPEVTPDAGLEYLPETEAAYGLSDKFPVSQAAIPALEWGPQGTFTKRQFERNDKPPVIIFGMKLRTFLLVAAVVLCLVIGAAVGGAVGGKNVSNNSDNTPSTGSSGSRGTPTSAPSSQTLITSMYTAPTPTYTPISDCPASNNTLYISAFSKGTSGSVAKSMGLNFTKHCDLANPLVSSSKAKHIAEAYVYDFNDCIEVCGGYNFWNDGANCSVAVFTQGGGRPGNCWVGSLDVSGGIQSLKLKEQQGTSVALLQMLDA